MNLVISAFSLPQTFGYGMPQTQIPNFSGGVDTGFAPLYSNQVSLSAPEEEYELEAAMLGALLGNFGAYQPGPQDWYRMALAGLGAAMPVLGMMNCCVLVILPSSGVGSDPQQSGGQDKQSPGDEQETPEPPSDEQSSPHMPPGGPLPFALGAAQKSGKLSDKRSSSDLAAKIDHYLEEQGSPAAGSGHLFVESGEKHQVDPLLLLAIAGHETVFGTEGVGLDGMLGVGAYDDNPNNATEDPKFAGVANQLEVGAQTFEHWRSFYGSDSNDSIEHQTEVVGQKWATDPQWAAGVMRHYAEIKAEIG